MYVQKIVPPYFPMLYLKQNYDVISYRIEYVKTNKKAKLSKAEAEALGLSDRDAKKYKIGLKYEPFLRIYRTVAPHESVEKFLKNGGNLLDAFKKPSLVQDTEEEVCFSTTFSVAAGHPADSQKRLDGEVIFSGYSDAIDDEDRKKFRIAAHSSKNNSIQSFEVKCLAIDEFFRKVKPLLEDPQRCYDDKISNDAIKDLSRVFNECSQLDIYSPDGFAEATSAFGENLLVQILIVVKFLKWQVGLAKNLNDSILAKPFRTKNILWYEDEIISYGYYTGKYSEPDFITEKYIFEEYDDGTLYKDIKKLMRSNPHEEKYYKVGKKESCNPEFKYGIVMFGEEECPPKAKKKKYFQIRFEPVTSPDICCMFAFNGDILCMYSDPINKGTVKSYWTGRFLDRTKKILNDITVKDAIVNDEDKFIPTLRVKVEAFYKDFIEDILKKDIEQYPPFIQDLLKNKENYIRSFIYAYYDDNGNIKSTPSMFDVEDLDLNGYLEGTPCEVPDYWFIFDFIIKDSAKKTVPNALEITPEFVFSIIYLADYSDTIKLAYQLEQNKSSVYKALQRIKALDPSDTIAERFLARFVSEELEKTGSKFVDKWDKFLGEETFSSINTQEGRAIEAFKLYRRTMQSIVGMLEKANKFNPILSFNNDPNRLPSLYKSVKDFILNKLYSESLLPVNREFGRDAVRSNTDIINYVLGENEKARLTRNKFAHGMDINKDEYLQFDNFCRRITRIADALEKIYTKKLKDIGIK